MCNLCYVKFNYDILSLIYFKFVLICLYYIKVFVFDYSLILYLYIGALMRLFALVIGHASENSDKDVCDIAPRFQDIIRYVHMLKLILSVCLSR